MGPLMIHRSHPELVLALVDVRDGRQTEHAGELAHHGLLTKDGQLSGLGLTVLKERETLADEPSEQPQRAPR